VIQSDLNENISENDMPFLFNKYYNFRDIIFFLGEGLLIFLSLLTVDWLYKGDFMFSMNLFEEIYRAAIVTVVFQMSLYFFDLYDLKYDLSLTATATRTTQAFGVGCIILGGIYYSLPETIIPSRVFWTGYLIICVLIFIWRSVYYFILRRRMFVQEIFILGTGKLAEDISIEIEGKHDSPYKVLGFIGERKTIYNPNNAPFYKDLDDIERYYLGKHIERIVVALDDRRGTTPIQELLKYKMQGTVIEQGINFYERVTGKLLVENMDPSWIIFSEGFSLNRWQYMLKRTVDILLSLAILTVSLPILILSVLIIKLESVGPIFYCQERVGTRNVPFKVYKFRSMRQDAEQAGAVWAKENDDRVTRYGGLIRKYRIDELPQLWNVLKGDMSLVGPRPERPVFVEKLAETIPFYLIRHDVKPGITGWAQVCYPYGASQEDALHKLEYDLYYIKNLSIPLDLLVVFMTIKTVLFRKGAR
jgi:sugar transferase (PEP-CTERM system associated)